MLVFINFYNFGIKNLLYFASFALKIWPQLKLPVVIFKLLLSFKIYTSHFIFKITIKVHLISLNLH